jgi:hypothetical protein
VVRALLGLLIAIATTAPARADVEDTDVIPVPRSEVAAGLVGHAGRYLGRSEGGFGPYVEVAAGRGRWQYFGELGATKLDLGKDPVERTGVFVRGGGGVRWLARSFRFDEAVAIDMNLEAFAGLGQLRWDHAEKVLRPDLGVGLGYQLRLLRWKKVTLRVSARAYFAPHDHSAAPAAACRGTTCTMPSASSSSSGLMALFGLAW